MQGLTVGRMVHYIAHDEQNTHCAAIITHVWHESGTVNLNVMHPFNGDKWLDDLPSVWQETSVTFDEGGAEPGTWHWIEPA